MGDLDFLRGFEEEVVVEAVRRVGGVGGRRRGGVGGRRRGGVGGRILLDVVVEAFVDVNFFFFLSILSVLSSLFAPPSVTLLFFLATTSSGVSTPFLIRSSTSDFEVSTYSSLRFFFIEGFLVISAGSGDRGGFF